MEIRPRLASIAGGDAEVLKQVPGDLVRYAAMGGVIISTALVASLSATLALHMALRMPWPWAVVTGLGWGAIIYNLDRLLVVQMVRHANKWHAIAIAFPRVVLAIILGAIISTPMVLQIFQPEIKTELDVMHAQEINNYNEMLANSQQYAPIPVLERRIPQEQSIVDAGVDPNVAAAPAVVAAQHTYNSAETAYENAEQDAVCELEGTCGSHHPGAGIVYQQKVIIRNDDEQKRNAAYTALLAAEKAAGSNLQKSQTIAVSAAATNLKADKQQLAQLQSSLQASEQAHARTATGDSGLLARLEALDQLSSDQPTLKAAHWALFALFLAIELLPVLMKLLQVLGPETDYEKMLAINSESGLKQARQRGKHDLAMAKSRLGIERKIERDRAKKAVTAGVVGNQVLIDTQAEVMTRVLDAWRQYAVARSEGDLLRWQQSHPVPPASATDPSPQPPAMDASQSEPDEPAPVPGPVSQDQGIPDHLNGSGGNPAQQGPPWQTFPPPRPGTAADSTVPGSYRPEATRQTANGSGMEPYTASEPPLAESTDT